MVGADGDVAARGGGYGVISQARTALLRVYAALDRRRHPEEEGARLEDDLRFLEVDVDELGEVDDEFQRFASSIRAERLEETEGPPIPLVRVVETVMDVIAAVEAVADDEEFGAALRTIAQSIVGPEHADDPAVDQVVEALRSEGFRNVVTDPEARWSVFQSELADRIDVAALLPRELRVVLQSTCVDDFFSCGTEICTRITTSFKVKRDTYQLDELADACMPANWSSCNDFFCSLVRCPDLDAANPGTTPDPPSPKAAHWSTVFEEKVGECPDGWFPQTFLLFGWDRIDGQFSLRYELALPPSATVLARDEGFVQVTQLSEEYHVSTQKDLLFKDGYGGGHTLGQYACKIGWMDYSIDMFTGCAQGSPEHVGPTPSGSTTQPSPSTQPPAAAEQLRNVVDKWEAYLRERTTEVADDVDDCVAKVRGGSGFNDSFAECAQTLATRTGRDGARWLEGQLDLALTSVDVAKELAADWRRTHGL